MTSKFSHMDLINQYFVKMRDRIIALKLENDNLKKSQSSEFDKLKKEFSSLSERHIELKKAFLESENLAKELIHEKEEILQKEKEFSEQIRNDFEKQLAEQTPFDNLFSQTPFDNLFPQTPKKTTSNILNESQKMKYLKAKKKNSKKLELKTMHESESDSEENNSEEESIDVMKKLIGNDLWNCVESSINAEQQQYQHKSSQTKLNQNEELGLLSNMFSTYLTTHGENIDFLRNQVSKNKK
jgi:hypothetical protein